MFRKIVLRGDRAPIPSSVVLLKIITFLLKSYYQLLSAILTMKNLYYSSKSLLFSYYVFCSLKFLSDSSRLHWFISTDMFYVEVVLEPNGHIKDVKINHNCTGEAHDDGQVTYLMWNIFVLRQLFWCSFFNPPLLVYAKLQPLLAPSVILTKLPSLLAPVVKMTKYKFQLRLGWISVVWQDNKNLSYHFPGTGLFYKTSMYCSHWKNGKKKHLMPW